MIVYRETEAPASVIWSQAAKGEKTSAPKGLPWRKTTGRPEPPSPQREGSLWPVFGVHRKLLEHPIQAMTL